MCLASNIARRAGSASYYARLGIPKDLQPILGKRELWESLRTKDAREAKARVAAVLARWHAEFEEVRRRRDAVPVTADALATETWEHYRAEIEHQQDERRRLPSSDEIRQAQSDAARTIRDEAITDPLARFIGASGGKDGDARKAEQIVYRDRLEAAGVPADRLPQMPERPSPGLTTAVRAVVLARLMHEAAGYFGAPEMTSEARKSVASTPASPAGKMGDIIVSIRDGSLAIQAPVAPGERRLPGQARGLQLPAFASGGVVQGPGGPREDRVIARLSPGEFITNAAATAKHRTLLEHINSGSVNLPKFADGGFVGSGSAPRMTEAGSSAASVVTIAPTINLQAAGGTPEQNADLAKQVGHQIEGSMRGLVCDELRRQMRPMGLLNRIT